MKRTHFIFVILSLLIIILPGHASLTRKKCKVYLAKEFISDEQEYRAEFNEENKAFFHATFFRNTTYRIIACNEESENVIFSVTDQQGNLIFSNSDYNYAPYWDFFFESTVRCVITVELPEDFSNIKKGNALLLIGFKK